jgi:hypothetical protein
MSSEYATEQVRLADVQEGDTIQDPDSGQWFTVTRTEDDPSGHRLYYGDERAGEQVDSRCVVDSRVTEGTITRQVRE